MEDDVIEAIYGAQRLRHRRRFARVDELVKAGLELSLRIRRCRHRYEEHDAECEWEHGKQKQYSVHGWSSPGTRNARGREPKSINVISQRELITPYGLQELGHLSSLSGRMGQNAVGTSTTKFLKI